MSEHNSLAENIKETNEIKQLVLDQAFQVLEQVSMNNKVKEMCNEQDKEVIEEVVHVESVSTKKKKENKHRKDEVINIVDCDEIVNFKLDRLEELNKDKRNSNNSVNSDNVSTVTIVENPNKRRLKIENDKRSTTSSANQSTVTVVENPNRRNLQKASETIDLDLYDPQQHAPNGLFYNSFNQPITDGYMYNDGYNKGTYSNYFFHSYGGDSNINHVEKDEVFKKLNYGHDVINLNKEYPENNEPMDETAKGLIDQDPIMEPYSVIIDNLQNKVLASIKKESDSKLKITYNLIETVYSLLKGIETKIIEEKALLETFSQGKIEDEKVNIYRNLKRRQESNPHPTSSEEEQLNNFIFNRFAKVEESLSLFTSKLFSPKFLEGFELFINEKKHMFEQGIFQKMTCRYNTTLTGLYSQEKTTLKDVENIYDEFIGKSVMKSSTYQPYPSSNYNIHYFRGNPYNGYIGPGSGYQGPGYQGAVYQTTGLNHYSIGNGAGGNMYSRTDFNEHDFLGKKRGINPFNYSNFQNNYIMYKGLQLRRREESNYKKCLDILNSYGGSKIVTYKYPIEYDTPDLIMKVIELLYIDYSHSKSSFDNSKGNTRSYISVVNNELQTVDKFTFNNYEREYLAKLNQES